MTTESTTTDRAPGSSGDLPTIVDPRIVEAYEAMITAVPDAGADGVDGILELIAAATEPGQLDAPWRSDGLKAVLNIPIVVTAIRKLPSDYDGGLPWFLVVDAAVRATGEKTTFTTGSVSVVAQLVKAWNMGALPLAVIVRQSARPSRGGYYPQHLEIVS